MVPTTAQVIILAFIPPTRGAGRRDVTALAVGSLTVIFIWILIILIYQRRLLPGVVLDAQHAELPSFAEGSRRRPAQLQA